MNVILNNSGDERCTYILTDQCTLPVKQLHIVDFCLRLESVHQMKITYRLVVNTEIFPVQEYNSLR